MSAQETNTEAVKETAKFSREEFLKLWVSTIQSKDNSVNNRKNFLNRCVELWGHSHTYYTQKMYVINKQIAATRDDNKKLKYPHLESRRSTKTLKDFVEENIADIPADLFE